MRHSRIIIFKEKSLGELIMDEKYAFYLFILFLALLLIILWAVFIIDTTERNQQIDHTHYYHSSSSENEEPKYVLERYHPVETYTSPYDNRDYVNQLYRLYPQYYYP